MTCNKNQGWFWQYDISPPWFIKRKREINETCPKIHHVFIILFTFLEKNMLFYILNILSKNLKEYGTSKYLYLSLYIRTTDEI
jgi:hypothetical protein